MKLVPYFEDFRHIKQHGTRGQNTRHVGDCNMERSSSYTQ